MRHGLGYRKLNKTSEHRKALFKNMLNSLIKYEQIITTLPKAKELKPQIDKVITIGKDNNLNNKKRLFSKLQDKKSVTKVFDELSKRYSSRKGGYSRVLKAGFRTGDDAPMAVIELVDRNPEAKKVDKKKVKTENKNKKTGKLGPCGCGCRKSPTKRKKLTPENSDQAPGKWTRPPVARCLPPVDPVRILGIR